jgi:hypothetical protein
MLFECFIVDFSLFACPSSIFDNNIFNDITEGLTEKDLKLDLLSTVKHGVEIHDKP